MSVTIAELMSKMPKAFLPENALGLDAVIQFKFTGNEAGDWFAVIKDGVCTVEQGTHPNPSMTVSGDSAEIIKIFTGELDAGQAFMQGRIRLDGSLNLAMKLITMFKMR